MSHLSDNTKYNFLQFYFGDSTTDDFSNWLWNSSELEEEVGGEAYLSLIDLDFRSRDDVEKAKDIVSNIYNSDCDNAIVYDKVLLSLESMIENRISLKEGCKVLADLSLEGYEFIPTSFVGYSSELDSSNDEEFYKDRIISDAKKIILQIRHKIVSVGGTRI